MNEIFRTARPFTIPLILALVAGAITAQQFSSLPPFALLLLAVPVVGLLWRYSLKGPAMFVIGLAWALASAEIRLHDQLPKDLERKDILVEGTILDIPDPMEDGVRFGFRIDAVLEPKAAGLPRHIRLSWYKNSPPLKAGERWRLRVRLRRPHGFLNPGGMDYELWLYAQGIRATGYVRESAENLKLSEGLPFSPSVIRQSVFDRLSATLAGREMAGIVTALVIGTENAISQDQWTVLRRTGTAHLVAISGSHISLVAGLTFFGARLACSWLGGLRRSPQTCAAMAAFVMALLYSALSGFAVPAQRALVMIFVAMGGIIAQRNARPLATLALALLAVTLYDPTSVLFAGFWLSFGAVALIFLAISGRLRSSGWWGELWKINWATSLGLAPLLLFFFQQVSLISPLANLLAVPTIGLLLTPLCLAGTLATYLYQPAGAFLLTLAEALLRWIWQVLQWLSDLPWAQWTHPAPPLWTLPFAVAGAALLLAPRGIPARWLGTILLIPALTAHRPPPAEGQFRLTLLDVGQGLAAAVQTRGHMMVFDTGPRYGKNFETGSAVIEPFLQQQGEDQIDLLIVSHGDSDHIGGADALLRDLRVERTYSSVPGQLARAEACAAGQSWEWDGVRFDMLSPFGALGNENNNSCVLRIESPSGSVLLTGDIEQAAENVLVERYGPRLKTDVLIAPHHGSNTSSSAAFLAQVKPRYVLIPAGYLNRYNFPHPDVLARYRAIGADVFDSANSGGIALEPGDPIPRAFRQTDGKYWNDK